MRFMLKAICISVMFLQSANAGEWQSVWSDEFNYNGLPDERKWSYEEGFIRNSEMQYYTRNRKDNIRVEKGVLVIEGRKETFRNIRYNATSEKWQEQRATAQYTSGSLTTLGKAAFMYGRLEVRAKMPQGKGVWPAIWMMGVNRTEVGWPRCGEIDIMEYVGKEPSTVHANNHFANPGVKEKVVRMVAGQGEMTVKEPYNDFHVYSIEWDEKEIKFFVDDKHYSTLNINDAGKGAENPFRKPQYLLLNFALGGSWGGEIDDRILPQKYEIDYVRVFKSVPSK